MRNRLLLTRFCTFALCLAFAVTAFAPMALAADPPQDQRKHTKDGWRSSKAPWTTDLDEKLVYIPAN